MQTPATARRQAQPTGVIETLSAGYAAVNRQLWVLLLPILVDLLLWLGPHVSLSPLVDPAVSRATEVTRQVAVGPRRGARNLELASTLDQSRLWLIGHADDVNALGLLVAGPVALPNAGIVPASGDMTFVTRWPQAAAIVIGGVVGSLLLGAWFYRGLALASTGVGGGPLRAGRATPRLVLRVVALVAALLGTALLLGLPVLLLVGFTALVSPPIAILGIVLFASGVAFAALHLFFSVNAIFVSNVGPLAAIQRSVAVVRRHLWASVALIVLTWLILLGMGRVWDALASMLQPPYGVALGIFGNAYIASGLIAAGMIFYLERGEQPEHA
ncbi:MAG: hypothetical protein JOY61_08630 [Chloroflexi bacterium]|nr:hypothetical protein [Chloroflexota bacterium]